MTRALLTVSAWNEHGIIPGWCGLCRTTAEAEGLADRFRDKARALGWAVAISIEVPSCR